VAVPIMLSPIEQTLLGARIRAARTECRDLLRAKIVMAAADGEANAIIARVLGVSEATVRKWRGRFAVSGMAGLKDLPRSGRRKVFTDVQSAEVKALACELPAESAANTDTGRDTGVALSRWSAVDLATEAVRRGIVDSISASTVRRWLNADAIKPWQHRSWIFPRDPGFAIKAARVLDLYARTWQGEPLGPEDYVISADEKSQLQALHRRHPDLPPGPGRTRRVEFEYTRRGTLAYFAAYDVHHARVIGRIAPKTGIVPFAELVEQVMTTEPYASARRVFWVVDNGSSHAGQASIDRMKETWPTAELVHLPIHASWLNQVEIYFSIVQRKAIKPTNFRDLDHLAHRVLGFEQRYNTTAKPFAWNYTRDDLNNLLKSIEDHDTERAA
jgi:transposase